MVALFIVRVLSLLNYINFLALRNINRGFVHVWVCCYVAQHKIDFHFIPAYSPVFGGLWEAAVKSTKFHVKRTIQKCLLTYEELNTVLVQIEAVLYLRLLFPMSANTDDYTYLTPGHFLIGTSLTAFPEHDFSDTSTKRLKMWNLSTQMVQSF